MTDSDLLELLDKKKDGKDKKKDKPCNFFNTPRGCVKGESCDFQHLSAGEGKAQVIKNRICDFYMTPQGCVKGIHCDFLHPRPTPGLFDPTADPLVLAAQARSAAIIKNDKPCSFFLTPRGCVKGDDCDFQHIRPAQTPGLASPYLPAGMSPYLPAVAHPNPYLAAGFGTAEGFGFPGFGLPGLAPTVAKKPKICEFNNTERGCVKGEACDFIHQKNRVCDFHLTPRGCRKGALCDFQHPAKEGETTGTVDSDASSGKAKSSRTTGKRYEPY